MTSGGDDQLYSVSKSPRWGGAIGVNKHRSGFKSSRGVPSRQSRPRTSKIGPRRPTRMTSDVPIGLGLAGERMENVPRVSPSLAGLWRTRSRRGFVQPIEEPRSVRTDRCLCKAATQGSCTSMRQIGPSRRPCLGQSRRDVQGVRMVPMNTRPTSTTRQLNRDLVPSDFVQSDHDVEVALLML